MNPILPGAAAIALYLYGTLAQIMQLRGRSLSSKRSIMALALLAAMLHGLAAFKFLVTPEGLDLSLFVVAPIISLMLVVLTWMFSLYRSLTGLFALIFPISALSLLGVLLRPEDAWSNIHALADGASLHGLLSLVAYTVLAFCFCQAILLLLQERALRTRKPLQLLQNLPPLAVMESWLFQSLWVGFLLLSLAIITGFIFLEDMLAQRVAHHTILSALSWLMFAALLWGHSIRGWRGRKASYWVIASFSLLALAYFGSKLVIEIILGGVQTDH